MHAFRFLRIILVLSRYDALFPFYELQMPTLLKAFMRTSCFCLRRRAYRDKRPGQRLALALQDLGPTFIKLGQTLATRADLLGDDIARDLSRLQDRLPPFRFEQAKQVIESELEAPLAELYPEFSETPVAAASIAQVHKATLPSGEVVAVKVIRPQIKEAFDRDLELFAWLARFLLRCQPSLERLRPEAVVETLRESVMLELDLRFEAAAADELRQNFLDDPDLYVPPIQWSLTSQNVLTLEWIDGLRVDDKEALTAAGHDTDKILTRAANAFFKQVYRDGFFHADLHPGNLFVLADGRLAAIDFGIMGRVDQETRVYLAQMLHGFLTADFHKVARIHFQAGYVPANKSEMLFAQACRSIGQPLLNKPLHEISLGKLLGQLFAITKAFEMRTQPQLLLLQKSMVVAEGIGRKLNDHVNMWELTRPLVEEWMRTTYSPQTRLKEAKASLREHLLMLPQTLTTAQRAMTALAALPAQTAPAPAPRRGQTGRFFLAFTLGIIVTVIVMALET